MDDPNQITNQAGSSAAEGAATAATDFVPLRLVLYPNGGSVELKKPDLIVGRHSGADIRLILPDVSRRHCRFTFATGNWRITDLGSTNGIFVNGEKVTETVLKPRDLVRIGSYIFEVNPQAESQAPEAEGTGEWRKAS